MKMRPITRFIFFPAQGRTIDMVAIAPAVSLDGVSFEARAGWPARERSVLES
jgi:hypothetical protein